ncbi:MAG: VOC family protein, partial [Burkholderiales bacterium]|nr:VOC family protein [Burkholderiales bacterium]
MIEMRACIDVGNLDRAIEFYTRAFELKVGRRLGAAWVELRGASCAIDLLCNAEGSSAYPGTDEERNYRRHWTPVHLDFVVEDVESAVRRAEAVGAKLDRAIQEQPYGRMANMADPFGNGFCLLEFRGRGYDEMLASDNA